jgi:uncharacterized protein
MTEQRLSNPAVVGLAGFGLTTMVLQFHNLGWMGVGPVVWLGLIFGGLAQLVAGFQESKTGNNFGYCAFSGYGSFWISLSLLLIGNQYKLYTVSGTDLGWFLVAWTLFTAILWVGSFRVHSALAVVFTLLLFGFVLLDMAQFGFPGAKPLAAYDLIGCALGAWYVMAHLLLADLYGRDVLPVGKPWVGQSTRPLVSSVAASGVPGIAKT